MHTKFLLVGMKVQEEKDGEKILLSDNTNSEAIMLQLVRFWSIGVWVSTLLPCI
jgi:hypothetical protein